MHTFSRIHPALKALPVVAAAALVLSTNTGCDATQASASPGLTTVSNSSQDCASIQNSRMRARCEAGHTGGTGAGGSTSTKWDRDQLANAHTIVAVGHEMNLPRRAIVIALAAAMQESKLRNLTRAVDHDSLGLFQQRPSQGWGSPSQVTNPRYAAGKFYEHLSETSDWQELSIGQACQAVQVSAYPDAYNRWLDDAEALAA